MRVAIGSDHRGVAIRKKVAEALAELHAEVIDVGTFDDGSVDYPDIAAQVARMVSSGKADRGILICGTGLGMSITANKFPGVRAAPCYDELTAEISRRHNNLNVLCLPGDMIGERTVGSLINTWLNTDFEAGRHSRRLEKIHQFEKKGPCKTDAAG
mgnify:CR=1 FL=1